jgi:NADH:ubiquinone reductase (H+-translocating)
LILSPRTVTLSPGVRPTPLSLNYDNLVIVLGTRLDYGKIPGMHEHGSPFKYLGDALFLRNQLVRMLEEAEAERDPEIRKRLLTFVVAGAGFSGVRCIAEMNEFLRKAVSVYHNIVESDLRLILLQRSDRILPEVTASLASFAQKLLAKRGVEIRLSTELKAVTANAVIVEARRTHQMEIISTRTAVVTAPAAPHPILTTLPLPRNNGRIVVDQTTEVPGWSQVWAIGDCAEIKQADGKISPGTATPCGRLKRALRILLPRAGAPQKTTSGSRGLEDLDPLGRRSAVAENFRLSLQGDFCLAIVARRLCREVSWLIRAASLDCGRGSRRVLAMRCNAAPDLSRGSGPSRALRGGRDSFRQRGFRRQGLLYCSGARRR